MKIDRTFGIPVIAPGLLAVLPAEGARAQSGPPASIGFHSNRDSASNHIYAMNADGAGQIPLTTGSSKQRAR